MKRFSNPLPFLSSLAPCALAALIGGGAPLAAAQTVQVGAGSYSTVIPSGEVGPRNFSDQPVSPKVAADFAQPIQTNDYWSSLLYPFFGDPYSNILYAHPLNARATAQGLEIGYTAEHIFAAADFLYPYRAQLTVGVEGLASSRAVAASYGDWTVTAAWEGGPASLEATVGHGLPYAFFRMDGPAVIRTASPPQVWSDADGVLGLTVDGKHYGVFAPTGSTWTGATTLRSTLNGGDYLSVALLPDASAETLALFRRHAYAFVTDSRVSWAYDEDTAEVVASYAYVTEPMETGGDLSDETMTALYRHQWLSTPDALTGHTYQSPRGEMRLREGSTFTTERRFGGVLPALPDRGDYNPDDLLALVQEAAGETLPVGPTYENGKAMGRFSHLVHIADQLGATAERDHFLAQLKNRLEDWFTAGGAQEYVYLDAWDVMTGYPSGYGADNQINDHHFHSSYAIMSAATVARFDPAWAAQDQWGGMVNLLIRDSNSWDREDDRFPFLRTFDAYAGHSWAAGHGDFAEGNNQESSSESMNFASAVVLWGEATGQDEIRDLGVYLHTTEAAAVDQYWFDVDDAVFPEAYPHVAIGMVWGGKGVHSTWFGGQPEFIHGINILPVTSGSLYLGSHPDYVTRNYDEIVAERGGQPVVWKDVLWQYLALGDPARALSYYFADRDYEPFDGESRAHTMHWLFNLKKMGHVEQSITADVPTYAVFRDRNGDLTYVAYNAGATPRTVTFSDGFALTVGPREMASASTSPANPDAPVVLLLADKTSGKSPLTVQFEGSRSFDPNGEALSYRWTFGDGAASDEADPVHVFTELGEHLVRLEVTNGSGLVGRDSVLVEVIGNGTPFSGTPVMIPATIEAENYDRGGEGRAYHDADANNIGLAYRPDEGVDIEGSSTHAFDVYWITAGEWLEYTFEAPETGTYTFTPYVASVPGFGSFRMLIDNVDVSGVRPVTGTGGWQSWVAKPVEDVEVEAGVHILRLEFDSATDREGWLLSLNWIEAARTGGVATEPANGLPTAFALGPNYPNPAGAATRFDVALPVDAHVAVEVFNPLGQRVAVLLDGERPAGVHPVQFETAGLAPGLYVYRMRAGDFAQTRRLLVVR